MTNTSPGDTGSVLGSKRRGGAFATHHRAPPLPEEETLIRGRSAPNGEDTVAEIHWLDSNGNWTTKADWTGGMVPGPTDEAVIDAAGSYTVSVTATIDVDSIEILDASAVLSISDVAGNQVGAGGVTNNGTLDVDADSGEGGSTLAIGATLSNSGTVNIGNTGLSKATTVTATGLSNTGTVDLTGSTTTQATLDITGAAPAALGNVNIYGDALLEFASGAVGGIAAGTTFSLRNDPTPLSF